MSEVGRPGAFDAHLAEVLEAAANEVLAEWLFAIQWPFDITFDPAPPVDIDVLARLWNQRDDWRVTHKEAVATVSEEAGLGGKRSNPTVPHT